jgi:hypothetical protein
MSSGHTAASGNHGRENEANYEWCDSRLFFHDSENRRQKQKGAQRFYHVLEHGEWISKII